MFYGPPFQLLLGSKMVDHKTLKMKKQKNSELFVFVHILFAFFGMCLCGVCLYGVRVYVCFGAYLRDVGV